MRVLRESKRAKPERAGPRLRVVEGQLSFGEVEPARLTPEGLLSQVEDLMCGRRLGSARRLVARFPDVTLSLLRDPPEGRLDSAALAFVASKYDQYSGSLLWLLALTGRLRAAERYQDYEARRRELQRALTDKQFERAQAIELRASLPKDAPAALLWDAAEWELTAKLGAGRFEEALSGLETTLGKGQQYWPQRLRFLLLKSELEACLKQDQRAAQSWRRALLTAVGFFKLKCPWRDPVFWQRAWALRPEGASLPGSVKRALAAQLGGRAGTDSGGHWLWRCVSVWRAQRCEYQAAEAAAKSAEALAPESERAACRLLRARALVSLKRFEEARRLLKPFSAVEDWRLCYSARALLGSVLLQQQQRQQGRAMLEAVLAEPLQGWPGRAEAYADLGLACLIMGQESAGLKALAEARRLFERRGQARSLLRALRNELRYWQHKGQAERARALLESIEAFERG